MVTELEKRMAEAIHKKYGGDRLTALATVMDLKDIIDKCLGSNDWDEGYLPDIDGDCECPPHVHHFTGMSEVKVPNDGYVRVDKICRFGIPKVIESNWDIHDGGLIIVGNESKKPPEKLSSTPNSKMIGSQNGDIELISYFPWTFFVELCNRTRLDIARGVIRSDGTGYVRLRRGQTNPVRELFDQHSYRPRWFSICTCASPGNPMLGNLVCTEVYCKPDMGEDVIYELRFKPATL